VLRAGGVFEYAIRLEDGPLDLLAWRGFAGRQSARHPVFFLNACDVGQSNRIANFVDGWAPAVLEAGASAYISGIWPLGDRGASEFASRFYRLLDDKARTSPVALSDIVRQTRKLFYETHDPTYLAYVYYGDAYFRVLKATQ
jgi:CHAT domain-containing protein